MDLCCMITPGKYVRYDLGVRILRIFLSETRSSFFADIKENFVPPQTGHRGACPEAASS